MGKEITITAKTVDEAIYKGLQEIGLSIDEVEISIVQKGSIGLLGIGAKPAVVKLTEKEADTLDVRSILEGDRKKPEPETVPETPKKAETHTETTAKKQEERKPDTAAVRTETPVKPSAEETVTEQENTVPAPEYRQPAEPREKEEEIQYSKDFAKDSPAVRFLSELLSEMGVEAELLAAETDNTLRIRIDSESAGVLIGHRGETLDAIQYLTLLAANRDRTQNEYTRVSIDTQGYREKREEVLVRLAKSKASTVRASGKPYKFEPMSPYERRIIHSTLQSYSQVTTHSEGEEPYRYVVITANKTRKQRPPRRRNNHAPRAQESSEE